MIEGRMAANDYKYDVFFSYKQHSKALDWTRGLYERLEFWLEQELGHKPKLFIDAEEIKVGDRWPERLKEALRLSRCMVCVWSPPYFQSEWCLSEWRSFLERERQLGLKSHGLIAPLAFHDGEDFPEEARAVQWIDVSSYAYTVPGFWKNQRAMDLEALLKPFCRSVAEIIRSAPQFSCDWPLVEVPAPAVPEIKLARL
jgi:hypothetical protein